MDGNELPKRKKPSKAEPHEKVVLSMKEQGFSVAQICKYLKSEHDLIISVNALHKFIQRRLPVKNKSSSTKNKPVDTTKGVNEKTVNGGFVVTPASSTFERPDKDLGGDGSNYLNEIFGNNDN